MNRDMLKGQGGRRAAPYLFLLPLALLWAIFMFYPLAQSLRMSFYKFAGPRQHAFVGLENYRYLIFHDRLFWWAVANTTLFTILFLALQIPLSLGLALLLNSRQIRLRNLFRFGFFSTFLVGQVFVAVVFISLLYKNPLFGPVSWLGHPNLALPIVLTASLWLTVGFGMIYFLAALQATDPHLYEAANVDGAGSWAKFWHITLPSLRPALAYVLLVGSIGAFQLFELPYVLFHGPGPGYRAMTIVMYLYGAGFETGDLGYASAIGWTLAAILLAICIAQARLTRFASEES